MDNKVITLLNDMVMSCDNENKDIYKDLIDKCDKLKQLCEDIKNNSTSIELLKLKYCNKYLYFEGFEGGSQMDNDLQCATFLRTGVLRQGVWSIVPAHIGTSFKPRQ